MRPGGGNARAALAVVALLLTSCDLNPRPEDPSSNLSDKGAGAPHASGTGGSSNTGAASGAGGAQSQPGVGPIFGRDGGASIGAPDASGTDAGSDSGVAGDAEVSSDAAPLP